MNYQTKTNLPVLHGAALSFAFEFESENYLQKFFISRVDDQKKTEKLFEYYFDSNTKSASLNYELLVPANCGSNLSLLFTVEDMLGQQTVSENFPVYNPPEAVIRGITGKDPHTTRVLSITSPTPSALSSFLDTKAEILNYQPLKKSLWAAYQPLEAASGEQVLKRPVFKPKQPEPEKQIAGIQSYQQNNLLAQNSTQPGVQPKASEAYEATLEVEPLPISPEVISEETLVSTAIIAQNLNSAEQETNLKAKLKPKPRERVLASNTVIPPRAKNIPVPQKVKYTFSASTRQTLASSAQHEEDEMSLIAYKRSLEN